MGIRSKLRFLGSIDLFKYIYFNKFCRNIKGIHKIIPYKGTRISIAKSAEIILNADLILNDCRIKWSKEECLILLRDNAKWTVDGTVQLYYGTTIQIHKNAELSMGEAHMNVGTTIICANKMTLGQVVNTGRGVFIFDSDHHPIYDGNGSRINESKPVIIGDNVWIGLKSTILKGAFIESGAVIGAHSLVSGNIPGNCLVATVPARPVMKNIHWER